MFGSFVCAEGWIYWIFVAIMWIVWTQTGMPHWTHIVFPKLLLLLWFFYRIPKRLRPTRKGVIAPSDGTVTSMEDDGVNITVSMFLSLLDAHVIYAPITGTVQHVEEISGNSYWANDPKSSDNYQYLVTLQTKSHEIVKVRMISGKLVPQISVWVTEGQTIRAGDYLGLIHFGSRCEVKYPSRYGVQVKVNDSVLGGESLLTP